MVMWYSYKQELRVERYPGSQVAKIHHIWWLSILRFWQNVLCLIFHLTHSSSVIKQLNRSEWYPDNLKSTEVGFCTGNSQGALPIVLCGFRKLDYVSHICATITLDIEWFVNVRPTIGLCKLPFHLTMTSLSQDHHGNSHPPSAPEDSSPRSHQHSPPQFNIYKGSHRWHPSWTFMVELNWREGSPGWLCQKEEFPASNSGKWIWRIRWDLVMPSQSTESCN